MGRYFNCNLKDKLEPIARGQASRVHPKHVQIESKEKEIQISNSRWERNNRIKKRYIFPEKKAKPPTSRIMKKTKRDKPFPLAGEYTLFQCHSSCCCLFLELAISPAFLCYSNCGGWPQDQLMISQSWQKTAVGLAAEEGMIIYLLLLERPHSRH